jgi:hypothetical protein
VIGPVEYTYEIATNDPSYPVIKLALVADVKPLPDSIRRVENAPVATGEIVDTFKVWPTAHPRVTLERGERISVRFRVWAGQPRVDQDQSNAGVNGGGLQTTTYAQSSSSLSASAGLKVMPPDSRQIKSLVTRDTGRAVYWVDLDIGPFDEPGGYYWRLPSPAGFKELADLRLELAVIVLGEALLTTPSWTGPVEVSLSPQSGNGALVGRIGIRKLVGSFHVSAVSSTLPFLKVESQPLIDGQNYLIKVSIKSVQGLPSGTVDGIVNIETDDPKRPRIEVPFKIKLVP